MNKDVTILVNSCDKYESVWDPFFRLLKIQWPECQNYKIVLNTETKVYNCDFLNIETICSGTKLTWSQRLKKVLARIDSDYVLYFLEDFFLQDKVSEIALLEAIDFIKKNKNIGYLGLKYNSTRVFKDENQKIPEEHFFEKDLVCYMNRVNSMTALWRKDYLISLLRNHETPWEFELYGSVRSRRKPEKVMVTNNLNGDFPPIFVYEVDPVYGYAINGGKWLPKNKELFDKFGIEVNYDDLGINYALYENAINPIPKEQTKQVEKLDLRERLYNIKKWPKKQKKKLIKTIRKIRSLI
jgi:hypothetical protein